MVCETAVSNIIWIWFILYQTSNTLTFQVMFAEMMLTDKSWKGSNSTCFVMKHFKSGKKLAYKYVCNKYCSLTNHMLVENKILFVAVFEMLLTTFIFLFKVIQWFTILCTISSWIIYPKNRFFYNNIVVFYKTFRNLYSLKLNDIVKVKFTILLFKQSSI